MPDTAPLSESTLLIMLSLATAPQHGYAIIKEVAWLSDDRVQLSTGTLYGAIKRLLAQRWIERVSDEPEGGRERKAYRLTAVGRGVLQAELTRLRQLVELGERLTAGGAL